jgi:hypothetical protein
MFHPDEPFFFCRGNHSAILNQRRSGIPHVRKTKYQHQHIAPVLARSSSGTQDSSGFSGSQGTPASCCIQPDISVRC